MSKNEEKIVIGDENLIWIEAFKNGAQISLNEAVNYLLSVGIENHERIHNTKKTTY